MPEHSANEYTIAWVDHSESVLSQIIAQLNKAVLTTPRLKALQSVYKFSPVCVQPEADTDRTVSLIQQNILAKCNGLPSVVFLDLYFGSEETDDGWQVGRELALKLRNILWPVPIAIYTRMNLDSAVRTQLSAHGFSGLIEGVLVPKAGEVQRRSGDTWKELFDAMIEKGREDAERLPLALVDADANSFVTWATGHPISDTPSFKGAARALAAQLFRTLAVPPKQVLLKQMGGGFSGSYLVKAESHDRAISWVIKIDERVDRLEAEVRGYRTMQSLVHAKYFPHFDEKLVTLYNGWWGAFWLQFEDQVKPLVEHTALDGMALAKVYADVWTNVLAPLHGKVDSKEVAPLEILRPGHLSAAAAKMGGLARYWLKIARLDDALQDRANRAKEFLNATSHDVFGPKPLTVSWAERIHGDLNCRNILLHSSDNTFKIIDFPHIAPGCLATDFTKAEAELVLILLDWTTGCDCDFNRLNKWNELITRLSAGLRLEGAEPQDAELRRVWPALQTIRNKYIELALPGSEVSRTYHLYLLRQLLPYLGYSDITVAKRHLALLWVGALVGSSLA